MRIKTDDQLSDTSIFTVVAKTETLSGDWKYRLNDSAKQPHKQDNGDEWWPETALKTA